MSTEDNCLQLVERNMSRLVVGLYIGTVITGLSGCGDRQAPSDANKAATTSVSQRPEKPDEYKLNFTYQDINEDETYNGQLLFRKSQIYFFYNQSSEILVIDAISKTVRFYDSAKNATSDLTFKDLEKEYEKYREQWKEVIQTMRKDEKRSSRISADIDSALIDPKLIQKQETDSQRIHLTGEVVDLVATGTPDLDASRRGQIALALSIQSKLQALRDADAIPPSTFLQTIDLLLTERNLRPTEMTFLFRISNAPDKYRWTYQFSPRLTVRDWEGMNSLDAVFQKMRSIPFERYERTLIHVKVR
jgi:hypothetical protein